MALLDIRNLSISVGGNIVVHNVSFALERSQTLGIVGESGCGKSLTALAIMGLLAETQIGITSGAIYLDGENLLELAPARRRALMGSRIAMIFQEPMTSLNPVYRIGDQITEMILQHEKIGARAAAARAQDLLHLVKIPDPRRRMKTYPHQLSGGMRQRVMIAMALACSPSLLIADEPTTALDVTVQAQILELIEELQMQTAMAVILISHDLGVVAQTCQSVAVMYRGQIVEAADVRELFALARHPYTRGLMASIPALTADVEELNAIAGRAPAIDEIIAGCPFHPRCERAQNRCAKTPPPARHIDNGSASDTVSGTVPGKVPGIVRCHYPYEASS